MDDFGAIDIDFGDEIDNLCQQIVENAAFVPERRAEIFSSIRSYIVAEAPLIYDLEEGHMHVPPALQNLIEEINATVMNYANNWDGMFANHDQALSSFREIANEHLQMFEDGPINNNQGDDENMIDNFGNEIGEAEEEIEPGPAYVEFPALAPGPAGPAPEEFPAVAPININEGNNVIPGPAPNAGPAGPVGPAPPNGFPALPPGPAGPVPNAGPMVAPMEGINVNNGVPIPHAVPIPQVNIAPAPMIENNAIVQIPQQDNNNNIIMNGGRKSRRSKPKKVKTRRISKRRKTFKRGRKYKGGRRTLRRR